LGSGKARDQEDDKSYGLDVNSRFFCGASFSRLVALDEMMPHMSKDHESWVVDDGNHVMVPNLNEMILIVAPVIRVNVQVPKPRGVDERLDPQLGVQFNAKCVSHNHLC